MKERKLIVYFFMWNFLKVIKIYLPHCILLLK